MLHSRDLSMVTRKKLVVAVVIWCVTSWSAVAICWYRVGSFDSLVIQVWLIGGLIAVSFLFLAANALKLGKRFAQILFFGLMFWNLVYFADVDPERIRSRMLLLAAIYWVLGVVLYLVAKRADSPGRGQN